MGLTTDERSDMVSIVRPDAAFRWPSGAYNKSKVLKGLMSRLATVMGTAPPASPDNRRRISGSVGAHTTWPWPEGSALLKMEMGWIVAVKSGTRSRLADRTGYSGEASCLHT